MDSFGGVFGFLIGIYFKMGYLLGRLWGYLRSIGIFEVQEGLEDGLFEFEG